MSDAPAAPIGSDLGAKHAQRDIVDAGRDAITINALNPNDLDELLALMRRHSPATTDRGVIAREMQRFIPPPQFTEHLSSLDHHQIVILTGVPGSGLPTAARHCWWRFAEDRSGLRLAAPLFPENRGELRRDFLELEDPAVVLLDLSNNAEFGAEVPRLLPELQEAMRARRCYLVLALPRELHRAAARSLPDAVFELKRPDPRAVAQAYLADSTPPHMLDEPWIKEHLDGAWPPRARRLARVLNASDLASSDLADLVKDQMQNWSEDLHRRFASSTAHERALLLASATLEGASKEVIAQAADAFIDITALDYEKPQLLEQRSLSVRFDVLAELFDVDRSAFKKPEYGGAALAHAWREFPSWRQPLRQWFDGMLRSLKGDALALATERLLALARAVAEAALVIEQAAKLADGDAGRRQLAALLLVGAATDPLLGRETRSRLWTWSYHQRSTSVQLQLLVAAVCGDPAYYTPFPLNALTRLKHLAKSDIDSVRRTAIDALVDIGIADYLNPRGLFEHMRDWLEPDQDPALRDVVTDVTVRLCRDQRLLDRLRHAHWTLTNDPHHQIRDFWQRLFATATPAQARAAVQGWLTAASTIPPGEAVTMADFLIEAASSDHLARGQLAQSANAPMPPGTTQTELYRRLCRRITTELIRIEVLPHGN